MEEAQSKTLGYHTYFLQYRGKINGITDDIEQKKFLSGKDKIIRIRN